MPIVNLPPEAAYLLERLINRQGFAEGTSLPPILRGSQRVQVVRSPEVLATEDFLGGTLVTLSWIDPEYVRNVSHYQIYARNPYDQNSSPTLVGAVPRSPALIRVMTNSAAPTPVVLHIQTVLHNGMTSPVLDSPSAVTLIQSAEIEVTEVNNFNTEVTNVFSSLLVGYDVQPVVIAAARNHVTANTITVLSESQAGGLLSIGVIVTTGFGAETIASRLKVQLDGGSLTTFDLFAGPGVPVFTNNILTLNSSVQGTGNLAGDVIVVPFNLAYNTSILVQHEVTTADAGATGVFEIHVLYARKT